MTRQSVPLFATLITLVCFVTVHAQQRITITPYNPKAGGTITIQYDGTAKGATLGAEEKLTAQIMILNDVRATGSSVDLERKGNLWVGSYNVPETKAQVFVVNVFAGQNAPKMDEVDESCPAILVRGGDGVPVKGAHLGMGRLLTWGGFGKRFKVLRDSSTAIGEFKEELKLYPDNWRAEFMLLSIDFARNPAENDKIRIKSEFENLFRSVRSDEEATTELIPFYGRLGMQANGDSIKKVILAEHPKGKMAQRDRLMEIYKESDTGKRAPLYEQFLDEFPVTSEEREMYQNQVVYTYSEAKQYEKALGALEKLSKPNGNLYNSVAWGMIENGAQLERATEVARKGVELLRKDLDGDPPASMKKERWQKSMKTQIGMALDTYGFGLFKCGRKQEAEKAYLESVALTDSTHAAINERLVQCLVDNGKPEKAVEAAAEFVRKGYTTEKLFDYYKSAYIQSKGSASEFDKLVEKELEKTKKEMSSTLGKTMLSKPAVQFALKDLDGRDVKLAGLKGKVVIVDFWATWCGPCKASFPYLQKVYDKYRSNQNVLILAVNTSEQKQGKERLDLVKQFMSDNKYTFPVLIDDQGVAQKFGVEGIPTKYVIDKQGTLRFESVGFGDGPRMITELTAQIDMLLNDDFYKKN